MCNISNKSKKLTLCYYLLYKLRKGTILWIVRISDDLDELKKHIKGFVSNQEKYYIISKLQDLSFVDFYAPHFTIFTPDKDYNIIDDTPYKI